MLFGIIGDTGCGKDTMGDHLEKNYNFEKNAMAKPLKKACQIIFSFNDEQIYGTQEQKETPDPRWGNVTPRKILQTFGSELMRDGMEKIIPGLGKDIWIRSAQLAYETSVNKNVVFTDIRFKNEADFIKKNNGILFKIRRNYWNENRDKEVMNHISEIEKNEIQSDYIIDNNGSLEDFYHKIDEIVELLLKK